MSRYTNKRSGMEFRVATISECIARIFITSARLRTLNVDVSLVSNGKHLTHTKSVKFYNFLVFGCHHKLRCNVILRCQFRLIKRIGAMFGAIPQAVASIVIERIGIHIHRPCALKFGIFRTEQIGNDIDTCRRDARHEIETSITVLVVAKNHPSFVGSRSNLNGHFEVGSYTSRLVGDHILYHIVALIKVGKVLNVLCVFLVDVLLTCSSVLKRATTLPQQTSELVIGIVVDCPVLR